MTGSGTWICLSRKDLGTFTRENKQPLEAFSFSLLYPSLPLGYLAAPHRPAIAHSWHYCKLFHSSLTVFLSLRSKQLVPQSASLSEVGGPPIKVIHCKGQGLRQGCVRFDTLRSGVMNGPSRGNVSEPEYFGRDVGTAGWELHREILTHALNICWCSHCDTGVQVRRPWRQTKPIEVRLCHLGGETERLFPHLWNKDNNSDHLLGLLWGLREVTSVSRSAWCPE